MTEAKILALIPRKVRADKGKKRAPRVVQMELAPVVERKPPRGRPAAPDVLTDCRFCGRELRRRPYQFRKYDKHYCNVTCQRMDRLSKFLNRHAGRVDSPQEPPMVMPHSLAEQPAPSGLEFLRTPFDVEKARRRAAESVY